MAGGGFIALDTLIPHRRSFAAVPICRRPLGFPWGKLSAERQRSRLMRAGEQLRFGTTAKLCFSAPRPSSGSLREPPSPRGRQGVHTALPVRAKAAAAHQRAGQSPAPTASRVVRLCGQSGSSAPTGRWWAVAAAFLPKFTGCSPNFHILAVNLVIISVIGKKRGVGVC